MDKETSITIRLDESEKRAIAKACKKLGVRPGHYTKQAVLDRLKGEDIVADNSLTFGQCIQLAMRGELTEKLMGKTNNGKAGKIQEQDDGPEDGEEKVEAGGEGEDSRVAVKNPITA